MCKRSWSIILGPKKAESMIIHLIIEEDIKIKEGMIKNNRKRIILNMIGMKMRKTKGIKYRKIMDIKIIKKKAGKIRKQITENKIE